MRHGQVADLISHEGPGRSAPRDGVPRRLIPALGMTWSEIVNTRLFLQKGSAAEESHELTLAPHRGAALARTHVSPPGPLTPVPAAADSIPLLHGALPTRVSSGRNDRTLSKWHTSTLGEMAYM